MSTSRSSWFRKKDIAALLAAEPRAEGQASLSAWDLTLLGIGCIMGTGVFVLTGRAAALYAGPAVSLSFLIAAFAASLAAMCYAEFASLLPVEGSAYMYAYATMGELPAFVMGWNLALQYLVGAACVAAGWSGYVGAMLHSLGLPPLPFALSHAPIAYQPGVGFSTTGALVNVPAVSIVAVLCLVLVRGIEASARLNAVVVAIKLTVVGLFLAFVTPHIDSAHWQPFVPEARAGGAFGLFGVLRASTMLFFAYLGFDAVSVAATETKHPKRDVPIGILASLSVCALVYVAVALVLTGVVSFDRLNVASPLAVGVEVAHRPWLSYAIDLGALAGLTSVLLVQLFALPRILQAMAHDQLLPPSLAVAHPRYQTPARLTRLCAGVCALGAGLLPIDVLADLTSEGTLLVFFLVGLGVMVLRRTQPHLPRGFAVPFGPYVVPGLCMSVALLLMAVAWRSLPGLCVWMAIGLSVYFWDARARLSSK